MLRASPPHCAQVAGDVQGPVLPTLHPGGPLRAVGRVRQQQTRACPSHPLKSVQCPLEKRLQAGTSLLGLGHQVGLQGSQPLARGRGVGCPCSAFAFTVVSPPAPASDRCETVVSIHGSENSGKIKQGHYKEKVLYVHGAEIRPMGRSVGVRVFSLSASISLPLPLGGVEAEGERSSQSDRHRLSDNSPEPTSPQVVLKHNWETGTSLQNPARVCPAVHVIIQ